MIVNHSDRNMHANHTPCLCCYLNTSLLLLDLVKRKDYMDSNHSSARNNPTCYIRTLLFSVRIFLHALQENFQQIFKNKSFMYVLLPQNVFAVTKYRNILFYKNNLFHNKHIGCII